MRCMPSPVFDRNSHNKNKHKSGIFSVKLYNIIYNDMLNIYLLRSITFDYYQYMYVLCIVNYEFIKNNLTTSIFCSNGIQKGRIKFLYIAF